MATTSIWAVKGWLGQVVIYVENPEKTANPAYYEKQNMTDTQVQVLSDVIDYASQTYKTALSNEHAEIIRHFVFGLNCRPDTARDEMMATKKHFCKTEGIVAFHGYQSFAPGEATPEIAHEIGVKLAERLWGERFQVIVTTHLDKVNHLHNHFVLNNISMVDGKKYYRSKHDYWLMQQESDTLCREYGLSVIEKPNRSKSKHYAEWKAEKDGRQTWRGMVKSDVDTAINQSMTERQFFENLRRMGHEIKIGKDTSVKPPGKERFVRLYRNFGEDYTIENIRRRILVQSRPEQRIIPPIQTPIKVYIKGTFHNAKKLTGLRALYFYYLYRMGVLPKKRQPSPKQVYFLFREDIRFIQNISKETRLMVKYKIDTTEQLKNHKNELSTQIIALSGKRKHLRYKVRSIKDEDKIVAFKIEIDVLSKKIGELRKEVRICDNIESRSTEIKVKLRTTREEEKTTKKSIGKELPKHESFRRRR